MQRANYVNIKMTTCCKKDNGAISSRSMGSGGQNRIFSPLVAATIVEKLSNGDLLIDIAKELGIHVSNISRWRLDNIDFDSACIRADKIAADLEVDNLDKIAREEPDVQRARLRCENIKWKVARRHASKYGDRLDVNLNQTVDIGSALSEAMQRVLPPRDPQQEREVESVVIPTLSSDGTTGSESVSRALSAEEELFS
jgi:hypothetical protein